MSEIDDQTHGEKSRDEKAPDENLQLSEEMSKLLDEIKKKSPISEETLKLVDRAMQNPSISEESLKRFIGAIKCLRLDETLKLVKRVTKNPLIPKDTLKMFDEVIKSTFVPKNILKMFGDSKNSWLEIDRLSKEMQERGVRMGIGGLNEPFAKAEMEHLELHNPSLEAQVHSIEELIKLNETLDRIEKNTSTRQQFKTALFSAVCGGLLVAVLSEIIRRFS